jgi:hypothetical protein
MGKRHLPYWWWVILGLLCIMAAEALLYITGNL